MVNPGNPLQSSPKHPGPSGVVPSSPVDGASVSSNHPVMVVPPHSTFTPHPASHLGSFSVSYDLIVSFPSC